MDLNLDISEDYPRRLVVFPSGQVLAFGGDEGSLVCIDTTSTTASKPVIHTAREYDDCISALAVSSDGRRVAVGFDDGSTRLYQYEEYTGGPHPFIRKKNGNGADDSSGDFLSQNDPEEDDEEDDEDRCWAGPPMEGLVRDMKFLPDSHWLAAASESGLTVINVESSETMAERYLQTQAEKEHDASGIRGVAINGKKWMASLAMDGRLCVWEASKLQSLSVEEKVPVYRDANRCVPHKDVGAVNGATVADRSCLPHWVQPGVLALPGKAQLQLRSVSTTDDSVIVKESDQKGTSDPSRGHIESIMALTSFGEHIVSSGRDGRVILWRLLEDDNGLPIAEFVEKLGEYESIPTSLYWNEKKNILYLACANATLEMVQDMHKKVQQKKITRANKYTGQSDKKANEDTVEKSATQKVALASESAKTAASPVKKPEKANKRIAFADSDSDEDTPTSKSPTGRNKVQDKSTKYQNDRAENSPPVSPEKAEDDQVDEDFDDSEKSGHLETQPPTSLKDAFKPVDEGDDDDLLENTPQKPSSNSARKKTALDMEDDDAIEKETVANSGAADSSLKELIAEMGSDDDGDIDAPKNSSKTEMADASGSAEKNTVNPGKNAPDTSSLKNLIAAMDSDNEDGIDQQPRTDKTENLAQDDSSDEDILKEAPKSTKHGETGKKTKRFSKQSKSTQEDEDDDDAIFDEENPSQSANKPTQKNSFIEDEAEDNEDEVIESATRDAEASNNDASEAINNTQTDEDHEDGATGHDDSGFGNYDDEDENSMQDDIAMFNEKLGKAREYSSGGSGGPVLPEPQPAFAPSSTPLDLSRRFLCWNNIGSITLLQGDDMGTRSTVDINFTDSAFRRPISFTDNMGFILGTLGDDGGMFATDLAHDEDDDLEDEDDLAGLSFSEQTKAALKKSQKQRMRKGSTNKRPTGSSIYFHRFETFGSLREKDWYLTLPDGERVLGAACGEGWAAVTTSRKFLRLYTSGGCQGQILWLPGTPVTMAGRNRFLAVIYHESMPLQDGTQKLGYMLYDAVANKTITKGSVSCISAGSSLSWIGFSNDCSLMAMDSDGMLSMLVATSMNDLGEDDAQGPAGPLSWEWSPLLDTVGMRKSSDDSFWPVTVYNGKLVCIPLKGGTQYPDATRRPITTTISLRLPLARSTLAKSSALEELCVRSNIALVQKKANNQVSSGELMGEDFEEEYHTLCAQVDKVTLKLFAATVEAGKLERALDLVDRLQLEKSYELAMTIADNHDKLVDHIEAAKERRFAPAYDEEEEGSDVDGHEIDYDNANSQFDSEPARTSPEHRTLATRRISPDANNSWKPKRPFDQCQPGGLSRNVRAKAF